MNVHLFLETLVSSFSENLSWYAAFAFPFFIVFWIVGKKYFKKIRIQEKQTATTHHFLHDLSYSFSTFLVFGILDLVLLQLESKGYTLLYLNISEYGWTWLILSFFVVLFLDDTYFYWSHRAMHHPKLYKFFHRVHHESTDPSPLTAFAFHPSEAVIENFIGFILPFILPLHFGVILAWQIFSMLNNVLGHLGYEVYPKSWTQTPLLKYKTASIHHNMHHQHFNGNYALYFTWWDKWMGTEFPDYEQKHKAIFTRSNDTDEITKFHKLRVINMKTETNDAYTIFLKTSNPKFQQFKPGQHLTIQVKINDRLYLRSFSISSTPQTETLSLTIKRIPNGIVTNHLFENLKPGDHLEATLPSGRFFWEPTKDKNRNYLLIAAGSGITPILSILKSILSIETDSKIVLLYANKSWKTIIFDQALNQLEQQFKNRLTIRHFFSRESNHLLKTGNRIDQTSLEQSLNRMDVNSTFCYLCGPELMVSTLSEQLKYLGVNANNIQSELFIPLVASQPNQSISATIEVTVYGKKHSFETTEKTTILEAALKHHITLPHSCKIGMCGTCKLKCIEGTVSMANQNALTEAEINEGYVLACQSYATKKHVKLETK